MARPLLCEGVSVICFELNRCVRGLRLLIASGFVFRLPLSIGRLLATLPYHGC